MSSTNKTTNLELSQFLGSDSPKWLTDYNADMEKIDAGYQTVKAQADATDLIVGGHTSSISTLQDTTTSQGTAITGLRTDVNGNSGSINTINELLGNGEPTTTNKTIIGAINELAADLANVDSNLTDQYILSAIDYVIATVTSDGVKTKKALLDELHAAMISAINNLPGSFKFSIRLIYLDSPYQPINQVAYNKGANAVATVYSYSAHNGITTKQANFDGNSAYWSTALVNDNGYTNTSQLTDVPASGVTYSVHIDIYKPFAALS